MTLTNLVHFAKREATFLFFLLTGLLFRLVVSLKSYIYRINIILCVQDAFSKCTRKGCNSNMGKVDMHININIKEKLTEIHIIIHVAFLLVCVCVCVCVCIVWLLRTVVFRFVNDDSKYKFPSGSSVFDLIKTKTIEYYRSNSYLL
jgi:hypothetical protein